MQEQASAPQKRRLQFRLSFAFCVTAMVAVGLAGVRYWLKAQDEDSSQAQLALFWFVPPAATVAALLMGRATSVVPVALGLLLCLGMSACLVFLKSNNSAFIGAWFGLSLAPLLAAVRLLAQQVTPARVALGMASSFDFSHWALLIAHWLMV